MLTAFATKKRNYRHTRHRLHVVIVAVKTHVCRFKTKSAAKRWFIDKHRPKYYSAVIDSSRPEVWCNITGYPGYQVSSWGRVKSLPRVVYRGSTPVHTPGRILSQSCMSGHYLNVVLYRQGQSKQYPVGRLVAKAFVPNPHHYKEIRYLNENSLDNLPSNLRWMSRKQIANYGHRTQKTYKAVCLWKNSDDKFNFPSIKSASKWLKKEKHLSISVLSLSKSISRVASPNINGTTVHGYYAKKI